jgi:diacylglycerol O-acyltransferase / wax synthase
MRQLTSLDAQFLALESNRQAGHVGGLGLLDPSTRPGGSITRSDLKVLLHERLPLLPPFQWKLVEVPLGLDYPYWTDDEEFDLDFHMRELALPAPGSDAQLEEQVARIFSRPLDRARPLWELYVIHGLESGYTGVLTKIHHALIDGLSGAEIMGLLLDLKPEGRDDLPPVPHTNGGSEPAPGQIEMLGRGLLGLPRYPLRALRALPRTLPHVSEAGPLNQLPFVGTVGGIANRVQRTVMRRPTLPRPKLAAPKTSFSGRVSPHRRFAFGELPLDEVKIVKRAFRLTVNDVVVSICAGAVRRWLLEHDELPDGPLVAQIPVSVRTRAQAGTYGNRILLMGVPLHTEIADPVERLRATDEELADLKTRWRALPAELLQDANHFIPPAVFHRAARLTFRLSTGVGRPTWNLVISNVPGPQFPLYMAGAKLVANYPVSVITDGMGLNITVMSYNGQLDCGIVADRYQMPDVDRLIGWLREELDALQPVA